MLLNVKKTKSVDFERCNFVVVVVVVVIVAETSLARFKKTGFD